MSVRRFAILHCALQSRHQQRSWGGGGDRENSPVVAMRACARVFLRAGVCGRVNTIDCEGDVCVLGDWYLSDSRWVDRCRNLHVLQWGGTISAV